MSYRRLLPLAVLCGLTAGLCAQEKTLVFQGAQVIPIAGEPIAHGVLVVSGGKIVAVGAAGQVAIPADAEVHDVTGKVMMPGLVDSHRARAARFGIFARELSAELSSGNSLVRPETGYTV